MSSQPQSPPSSTPVAAPSSAAPHLAAIERWTVVLAAALVGTTLFWGGPRVQLGACVGGLLSMLNARALRFMGARLTARLQASPEQTAKGSLGLLVALFQLKLGVLAALIYLALKLLPISPVALLLGLSVLPLAIVARGIQFGLQAPPAPTVSSYSDSYRES